LSPLSNRTKLSSNNSFLGNSCKSIEFPSLSIGEYKMTYTMRDVNRLRMDRGWPKLMALEYYIELAQESGNDASRSLMMAYTVERRKR